MSQFYGEMFGSAKTTATRRGHRTTGLRAHIRGWEVGVEIHVGERDGKDTVSVWKTGGSNGGRGDLLAEFTAEEFIYLAERKDVKFLEKAKVSRD